MARSFVAVFATALVMSLLNPPAAVADPTPIQPRPASAVTADRLPTVQINGVVWSQAVVGNTVYAGGSFSQARPAGAAPGTSQTPRANLLAYDITTGNLITSFDPTLNGQVRAVAASPDGTRIYVVGDFTTANGQTRHAGRRLQHSGRVTDHLVQPGRRLFAGPGGRCHQRHRLRRRRLRQCGRDPAQQPGGLPRQRRRAAAVEPERRLHACGRSPSAADGTSVFAGWVVSARRRSERLRSGEDRRRHRRARPDLAGDELTSPKSNAATPATTPAGPA